MSVLLKKALYNKPTKNIIKEKKKRPTFSVLIPEDISFIEHAVVYSLIHKTVTFHHCAGFYQRLCAKDCVQNSQ